MSERVPFATIPDAIEAMRGVERYLASAFDRRLLELVKLRISMLNGCAYCVDLHWQRLRELGEPEARLYSLSAWREQGGYTDRERAALAWAESVNAAPVSHVPDSDYIAVSQWFSPKEIGDLTVGIAMISAWNRLCVALRIVPKGGIQVELKDS